jgi:hypothetical protein
MPIRTAVWGLRVVVVAFMANAAAPAFAQERATLCGRVLDATGGLLPAARISASDLLGRNRQSAVSGDDGRYCIVGIPPGEYRLTIEAAGFRTSVTDTVSVTGGNLERDLRLDAIERAEHVVVRSDPADAVTSAPSHRVDERIVQEMPLNGRHLMDLTVSVPGAVAPSQAGFSSRPGRGVGPVAVNIAGNREEAVAFLVNGISVNNLTFGSLIYEPPLASVGEIRVDTATFPAEHGHVSGAIVNIATRAGTDQFRGEAFEMFRHDALDARNFFEPAGAPARRSARDHFGGSVGGPVLRGRSFFFVSYEGVRQEQDVPLNSLVPGDRQRAAVTDPVIQRLLPLIPRANVVAADGTERFVGSAPAEFDSDRWTIDLRHQLADNHRLHLFKGSQRLFAAEPAAQGNSIPGFGSVRSPSHGILTLVYEHAVGRSVVNEARVGRSRLDGGTLPAAQLNPADFGIANGVTEAIGLPQIAVAGDLNFGGPGILPQGRFDTSWVFADVVTLSRGRHGFRFGGEYRHFINENVLQGTGAFNFSSLNAFLAGTANAFSITLGERRSVIDQRAAALFVQDRFAVRHDLTLEYGLRYEWHVTPTEREGRLVIFDAPTSSLRQTGSHGRNIYQQNNRNFEPRLGLAWDVSGSGRTMLQASYARTVDQPSTTAVRDTAGNPPFATPLTAAGAIGLDSAIERVVTAGLAPVTIDPAFRNAGLHAWTVRLQRQVTPTLAATAGYLGSKGADLRIGRNLNQPVDGVRPYPQVAESSPIVPGRTLGNITQIESTGFSSYQGAWISVAQRRSRGVQFDASYTWSRSLDTNSLNSSGFAVQDSYDIAGEYGPSDFDARHRLVFKAFYDLPFDGHALTRHWHLAVVVQSQSGNPVNIVTSTSSLNGLPNTVRPDVVGDITIVGSPDRWFDPSAFVAANRFGNLGRNAVIGPAFHTTDVSISKQMRLGDWSNIVLRVDVFNLFNQVNLGPPGNIVGSPLFGKITRTRFAAGDTGSSRQVQLVGRVSF